MMKAKIVEMSPYQAAPSTETPMEIAIPMAENVYGEICTIACFHELDATAITVDRKYGVDSEI